MKTLRYPLALFAALVLCLLTAPAPRADTTTMTGGAGAFRLEQAYVNVPDMNVFFYAQDAEGNALHPHDGAGGGAGTDAGRSHAGRQFAGAGQQPGLLPGRAG